MTVAAISKWERRLLKKIDFGDFDGCWEWNGTRSTGGYGYYFVDPVIRAAPAHRVVYEYAVGPIPEGLEIDHLCRNRGCVNPDHLEPVTPRENRLRGESPHARHARKMHCINGHPFVEGNIFWLEGRYRICLTCRRQRDRARYQRRKASA